MACEYCTGREAPRDYGFDLSDDRVTLEIPSACDCCDGDGRIHCTLTGETHSTSWWTREGTQTHTWEGFDVRALTAEERKLPNAGHWTDTVGGNHGVHALTDTTFLEECGECDGTGRESGGSKVVIYVQRTWHTCECGHGQDYTCTYRVKRDGKDLGLWFSSEDKAEQWVSIEFPDATYPEPDHAWESERALRRAEGW